MGKFGILNAVDKKAREMHRNLITKVTSFDELLLHPEIRNAVIHSVLGHLEYQQPTHIQIISTKMMRAPRKNALARHDWLLAAETGSGKTLAYLAPLMSTIKEKADAAGKRSGGVKMVVLVPTLELVSQVGAVAGKIGAATGLTTMALDGSGPGPRQLAMQLSKGVDVLVCSPTKLLTLAKHVPAMTYGAMQQCDAVVVDEADSLMNESFEADTERAIRMAPGATDLVFCTATIPRQFDRALRSRYPDTFRIVTPSVHRAPKKIDFRVVEVFRPPYYDDKRLALLQALYAIHSDGTEEGLVKRVVIFVNKRDDVAPLVAHLNKNHYPAVGIDGAMSPDERRQAADEFLTGPQQADPADTVRLKALVCTDLMARGVDMKRIRNVILYDLPYSSSDLLHRIGRTGRLNSRGRCLLLVSKKESQGWVRGLQKVVKAGLAIA